jgi:hypothetical protein
MTYIVRYPIARRIHIRNDFFRRFNMSLKKNICKQPFRQKLAEMAGGSEGVFAPVDEPADSRIASSVEERFSGR